MPGGASQPAVAEVTSSQIPAQPVLKKRARKEKPAADAITISPIVIGKIQKPKPLKEPKLPKKLMQFDVDILEFVQRGEGNFDRLLLLTGVDPRQFSSRIEFLCKKGYLCKDEADAKAVHLGLTGYDELAKRRQALEKKAARSQKALEIDEEALEEAARNTVVPNASNNNPQLSQSHLHYVPPSNPALANGQANGNGSGNGNGNGDYIDLFDLLRRGSPKTGDPVFSSAASGFISRQAAAARKVPFDEQVKELGGKEVVKKLIEESTQSGICELCRAPFKLSANAAENNPKYGYCFCGAAYHKDCYESLAQSTDSACVRCGKKMRIQMDRSSEEAVKAIKKMFD